MKHKVTFLIGICVIVCFSLFYFSLFRSKNEKQQSIEIRTDQETIYKSFPSLPKAKEMQWHGESSSGIGLMTVRLYLFAFYDKDVKELLLIDDRIEVIPAEITPYFLPEQLKEKDIVWQEVEKTGPGESFFQEDISMLERWSTKVYFNETWNIIYMEAIGD